MRATRTLLLAMAVALTTIIACSDDDPSAPVLTAISISPFSFSVDVGFSRTLRVQGDYDDGSFETLASGPTFASSNEAIAVVDATGTVTGISPGDATITANFEDLTADAQVEVEALSPVESVAVSTPIEALAVGETAALVATVLDSSGTELNDETVTWSSSNPIVATVSASGVVSAVREGEATITASAGRASGQIEIPIVWGAVDVDLGTATPVESMSGILHGFGWETDPKTPPAETYTSIAPRLWRSTARVVPYETARGAGALYTLIISDLKGYPDNGWLGGQAPYADYEAFAAEVRQIVRDNVGRVDVWEIWNEPTIGIFWDGTDEQFFQTYLTAYEVLREELGDEALIAGPSIHSYDQDYLDRFADFCVTNGCEANVLVWHENGSTTPIESVRTNALAARERYLENPAYAALDVQQIHVNEFGSPLQVHSPVVPLLYMAYLELGQVEGAATACWPSNTSPNECYDGTLDGLLTPVTYEPRSNHWARRLYAQGVSTRVASASTRGPLLALGSTPAGSPETLPPNVVAQVLTGIGLVDNAPASASIAVRLQGVRSLPGFAEATSVQLLLSTLEPLDLSASPGPSASLVPIDLTIAEDGSATWVLESALRERLYQLTVAAP